MRILKRILLGLVAVLVILVAVAYALPRKAEVERSVVIEAPPEKIFARIKDLRQHGAWSPWEKIDPDMTMEFSGPDSGVGQKSSWTSDHPNVGKGSQEIVEMVENEQMATRLDFGDMGEARAEFLLAPEDGVTTVTWRFETDLGNNPVARWMGLMMERFIGPDYEKGLAALKKVVEDE